MYAARPPASVDVFFDEKAFAFRFVRLIVNGRMRIRCAASHLSRGACSELHLVVQRLQVLPPLSKCDSGLLSQLTRPSEASHLLRRVLSLRRYILALRSD